MRTIFYIQILVSYLCIGFIALYYNVIDKAHTGAMDRWAIVLLILAILGIFAGWYFLASAKDEETKLQKVFRFIVMLPAYLLLLPIGVVVLVVFILIRLLGSDYFVCKPLRKKGFKYREKYKPYAGVLLTRDNVVIKFECDLYMISFDNGETFVDVVDSDLGTAEEREELRAKALEYMQAPSIAKQRCEVAPPTKDFVSFLAMYL